MIDLKKAWSAARVAAATAFISAVYTLPAYADINPTTGEEFSARLIDVFTTYITPVAGAVALIAISYIGIQMIISRRNPEKAKEAMEGLGHVAIGVVLISGGTFFAGLILGIGQSFNP